MCKTVILLQEARDHKKKVRRSSGRLFEELVNLVNSVDPKVTGRQYAILCCVLFCSDDENVVSLAQSAMCCARIKDLLERSVREVRLSC